MTKQLIQEVEQVTERITSDFDAGKTWNLIEKAKPYSQVYRRLREYETAEEEGRLVVLPCKNWLDIVFGEQELFYGIDMNYIENPIREIAVHNEERFTWYDGWKTVVLKGVDENGLDWEFTPEEIGKTVFLTREEAEKALKEMKNSE